NRCLYVILTRFSAEGPYDRWGFVTAVNERRAAVPILLLVRLRDHDAPVHSLPLSFAKILCDSEINNLRKIRSPAFCYEFKPCSALCGFGLAFLFGCFRDRRCCNVSQGQIVSSEGFNLRMAARCRHANCLNEGVHPTPM